jgi:hypothetical protein
MLKPSPRYLGKASRIRVTPSAGQKPLRFRLDFRISQSIEFDVDVKGAMSLMRLLQSCQKKYRWPLPPLVTAASQTKH